MSLHRNRKERHKHIHTKKLTKVFLKDIFYISKGYLGQIMVAYISFVLFFVFWFFRDRVSLYSPGCPGTHSVDQAGLNLRNPPASASQSSEITVMCHHSPAIYLFIICKYTVSVFRHHRVGHQISLRMVVSDHVFAGI